jgi:hypothetical protein
MAVNPSEDNVLGARRNEVGGQGECGGMLRC